MNLSIHAKEDGTFDVLQAQPVWLATFADREKAEAFMALMVDDAMEEIGSTEAAEHPEPAAEPSDAQDPVAVKTEPAAAGSKDWTDDELEQAFERLARGDKMLLVADHFGKSFTKLRGKWAAHQKAQRAAEDNHEKEECRLCGTPFLPTPSRLDVCARCDG